jgi:hypothetical protein
LKNNKGKDNFGDLDVDGMAEKNILESLATDWILLAQDKYTEYYIV